MQLSVIGIILCMTLIFIGFKMMYSEENQKSKAVDKNLNETAKKCSGNCGCKGSCGGGNYCKCRIKSLKELKA